MIRSETSVSSEDIKQDAKHTLFVEGKENSIDPIAIRELLDSIIRVRPFGPSFHITAAAEALVKEHPNYYFLIDRDHHDSNFIRKCWNRFPDSETANLLVWHRRELENYFIIPEYLLKSDFLVKSEDELRALILKLSKERLFLDAANLVIIQVREKLKKKWIKQFEIVREFQSKEEALNKLIKKPEFGKHKRRLSQLVGDKRLKNIFLKNLEFLTGGKDPIEYGHGQWLEMIKGKKVLPTVINKCFKVKNARGRTLQGKVKLNEVVKNLVKIRPLDEQPDDFQRLYSVINTRIAE